MYWGQWWGQTYRVHDLERASPVIQHKRIHLGLGHIEAHPQLAQLVVVRLDVGLALRLLRFERGALRVALCKHVVRRLQQRRSRAVGTRSGRLARDKLATERTVLEHGALLGIPQERRIQRALRAGRRLQRPVVGERYGG